MTSNLYPLPPQQPLLPMVQLPLQQPSSQLMFSPELSSFNNHNMFPHQNNFHQHSDMLGSNRTNFDLPVSSQANFCDQIPRQQPRNSRPLQNMRNLTCGPKLECMTPSIRNPNPRVMNNDNLKTEHKSGHAVIRGPSDNHQVTIQSAPKPSVSVEQSTSQTNPNTVLKITPPVIRGQFNNQKNRFKLNRVGPIQQPNRPQLAPKNEIKVTSKVLLSNPQPLADVSKIKELSKITNATLEIQKKYLEKLEEQRQLQEKIKELEVKKRKLLNDEDVCKGKVSTQQSPATKLEFVDSCLEVSAKRPFLESSKTTPTETKPVAKRTLLETPLHPPILPPPVVQSVPDTEIQPTNTVKISGLDGDTRESVIRKTCRPYGMVQSIEFGTRPKGIHYALVKFELLEAAKNFVQKCSTTNLTINSRLVTLTYSNWFVHFLNSLLLVH